MDQSTEILMFPKDLMPRGFSISSDIPTMIPTSCTSTNLLPAFPCLCLSKGRNAQQRYKANFSLTVQLLVEDKVKDGSRCLAIQWLQRIFILHQRVFYFKIFTNHTNTGTSTALLLEVSQPFFVQKI